MKDKLKDSILYNSSNILEFIDEISPMKMPSEKKVKSILVASMFPELAVTMEKPRKPLPLPELADEKNLTIMLSDSESGSYPEEEVQKAQQILEDHQYRKSLYERECEDYDIREKEYDSFCDRQKKLFSSAKKYMDGHLSWNVLLEYYQTSTHLKYILETQSTLVSRYIKKSKKKSTTKDSKIDKYLDNFKKIVPNMVEFYLLFGKCAIAFSKVVEDEVEVLDPMQLVNTQMLLPSALSGPFWGPEAYSEYRKMGWRDWDPINYIDVMSLPALQAKSKLSADDIKNDYSKIVSQQPLSIRFDLPHTIPVVGRKAIMREKIGYLGGDASLVTDNLWLLATLELVQNIQRITAANLNMIHIKDPSLGLESVFESNEDTDRDDLNRSLDTITSEGSFPVFTTTVNSEMRVNTVPMDHLPAFYNNLLRQLYSKFGMDVPEQVSSLKDAKKSALRQEYWIANVGNFTFERYCNMLLRMGKISEVEKDSMIKEGVFETYPRIDIRNPEEINGQKSIWDSLAVAGKATIESKKILAEKLFDLEVDFEEEKENNTNSNSNNKISSKPKKSATIKADNKTEK